mmetsp:Transcript_819/g.1738  ORF Transcript_819/g.1738 Transcript_819/m.1738 type:complete len:105 (+) Transcript_819:919-1233(+)
MCQKQPTPKYRGVATSSSAMANSGKEFARRAPAERVAAVRSKLRREDVAVSSSSVEAGAFVVDTVFLKKTVCVSALGKEATRHDKSFRCGSKEFHGDSLRYLLL